jgi:hypothetical protein
MAKWKELPPSLEAMLADTIWAEFKDKWDGEKKFALREVVKYLRGKDDVGTVVDTDVSGGS